jgi:hypothetical protein
MPHCCITHGEEDGRVVSVGSKARAMLMKQEVSELQIFPPGGRHSTLS